MVIAESYRLEVKATHSLRNRIPVFRTKEPQRRVGLPTNGLITIKPRLLCSENRTNEELKALDVQQSEVSKRMLSVKGDCGSPGNALRESCMWFYELKTVARGRTKYRWERVRKLRRSMTRRPALRSGNLPALAILRLLLEDSNPNLQPEDHVIRGLHRE
jgi:hypothetical protein